MLLAKEITVLVKYLNFADIFFKKKSVAKFFKHLAINKHSINPKPDKQPPHSLIYNLKPDKLKIFKTYIKTNLANSFIRHFKSFAKTLIIFF